jgi:hypothetical protein
MHLLCNGKRLPARLETLTTVLLTRNGIVLRFCFVVEARQARRCIFEVSRQVSYGCLI